MIELIGWIGSICFALCGAPQAIQCVRQGHACGLSHSMLALWFLGEICYIISVWATLGFILWMMANYILNLVWLSIIAYYSVRPRQ